MVYSDTHLGSRELPSPMRRVGRVPGDTAECCGVTQRILYGGRWWLPPSPGHGESCVSKCPWLVPTPKGVPECEQTTLWFVLGAESSLIS